MDDIFQASLVASFIVSNSNQLNVHRDLDGWACRILCQNQIYVRF